MYLKSLELQGFKSFPDKTVLNFVGGATVIVGPNGSGKSNITDAMRWVLGELSSKSIRGNRMEDVIFIGTEVRKPMSYAEVSVTFDNSSEEGRINSPYDEVTVTRRYFRAGESQYLINRQQCRLRDIYELFMNTGVGREGYSIIGQGRIAEIISKKSEDRRNIFEEASGISKFRYKRDEAEKRLKQTQDNMDRVLDIFQELERRVGPLEREAEKARKYNEIYERKKVLDVSLWIYDTDKTRENIEEVGNVHTLSSHEIEMAEDTISQIDNQYELVQSKLQQTRIEIEKIWGDINACEKTITTLDSELKIMEAQVNNANFISDSEIEELERLESKRVVAQSEFDSLNEKFNEKLKQFESMQESYQEYLASQKSLVDEIRSLTEKIDKIELDKKIVENSLSDIKIQLSIAENSNVTSIEKADSITSDLDSYKDKLDELTSNSNDLNKQLNSIAKKLEDAENSSNKLEEEITSKTQEYDELKEKMNDLKSKSSSLTERINALKSMEELFEGYSRSVALIMNHYKKNEIPNVGSIYGPVSSLIHIEDKYITAIETALGVGLQHIVVDDENTAKACISFLKDKKGGRATFYPVSSITPLTETIEMHNAKSYEGYIGVANELIDFDDKFDNIFSSLLGRTLIFDNLDNATIMAKDQKYRVKVVTLDGQVINTGGSFTGGSSRSEGGVLSRNASIKNLTEENDALIKQIEEIKSRGSKLGEDLRNLISKRPELRENINSINADYVQKTADYETIIAQLNFTKNLVESLEADNERINKEKERNKGNLSLLNSNLSLYETKLNNLEKEFDSSSRIKKEKESQLSQINESLNNKLMSVVEIKKDVELSKESIDSSKARLDEILSEINERNTKIEDFKNKILNSEEYRANNRKQHDEATNRLEELKQRKDYLSNYQMELEQKSTNLNQRRNEIQSKKEVLVRSNESSKTKLEQLKINFDTMTNRLYDEYGLTYSDAVDLGYPEVTEENKKEKLAEANELKQKIKNLGSVNLGAIEEYKEVKERYDYMNEQITDLTKSKNEIIGIIQDLETDMKTNFIDAFNKINDNFNEVFRELFGGGHAELSLTDENDVLNCGIEIKAAPPGKVIKSLMLLSGGEQSFIAIALLFAILRVNPTPFCIFDEIEAALDEVNVKRFGQYIKRYSDSTQFIVITHRRGTMEIADKLYGVTMPQKGISKVLTIDVDDVGKDRILTQTNAQ